MYFNDLMTDLGIYLHIPFCRKRCHFCAFYLVKHQQQLVNQFLQALEQEMVMYARLNDLRRRSISTVYYGGGTPTALSSDQLTGILAMIRSYFSLSPTCEITVEATPESITAGYAKSLRQAGVTRLSMGIQSFDQRERARLGLSGTAAEALTGIHTALGAGFAHVNLDVMYGIPGQSDRTWDATLVQALELHPTHLSCYALTLETGTRFFTEFRRGAFEQMNPDKEFAFQSRADALLSKGNFRRYEISNWAQPGHACQHNLRYWQGLEYLGLGPSAQSYISGRRFGNVSNLAQYVQQVAANRMPVAESEHLPDIRQAKERIAFGLRLIEGIPLAWIQEVSQDEGWWSVFKTLLEEDYLFQTASQIRLTRKGRQFADTVGMRLL